MLRYGSIYPCEKKSCLMGFDIKDKRWLYFDFTYYVFCLIAWVGFCIYSGIFVGLYVSASIFDGSCSYFSSFFSGDSIFYYLAY